MLRGSPHCHRAPNTDTGLALVSGWPCTCSATLEAPESPGVSPGRSCGGHSWGRVPASGPELASKGSEWPTTCVQAVQVQACGRPGAQLGPFPAEHGQGEVLPPPTLRHLINLEKRWGAGGVGPVSLHACFQRLHLTCRHPRASHAQPSGLSPGGSVSGRAVIPYPQPIPAAEGRGPPYPGITRTVRDPPPPPQLPSGLRLGQGRVHRAGCTEGRDVLCRS